MSEWVEVELWNADHKAVEAVANTFKTLGGAPQPAFREEDGKFYVRKGFAEFAGVQQGYVKRVIPSAPPTLSEDK